MCEHLIIMVTLNGGYKQAMIDRRDITIYRDPFAYCSHASIAGLMNGDWIVAFNECQRRNPYTHPPSDPHFHNVLTRSTDSGKTWSVPQVIPSWDWYGVECPGITQVADGAVVLNQWRFGWHSLQEASGLVEHGVAVWLNTGHAWEEAHAETDWQRSLYPWVRTNKGCYLHFSRDYGRTWTETVCIDTGPYIGGYTPRNVVELTDGTLLMCTADHPTNQAAYCVRSVDGGATWSSPIEIGMLRSGCSEPAAVVTDEGRIVVMIRHDGDGDTSGFLHQSVSTDGGSHWSTLECLPIWGYPAHLLQLTDGRLLATYGYRREPFGIRACLSRDGGRNWDDDAEIVLRADLRNRNLGYPESLQLPDGSMFTVYYAEDNEGVTSIQGSYWRVP